MKIVSHWMRIDRQLQRDRCTRPIRRILIVSRDLIVIRNLNSFQRIPDIIILLNLLPHQRARDTAHKDNGITITSSYTTDNSSFAPAHTRFNTHKSSITWHALAPHPAQTPPAPAHTRCSTCAPDSRDNNSPLSPAPLSASPFQHTPLLVSRDWANMTRKLSSVSRS